MRTFQNVARLIKEKRLAHPKKLSQTQLSKMLGYKNGQFISNVERGLCSIPLRGMKNAIDILEISPLEIKEAMLKDYQETLEFYMSNVPTETDESSSSLLGPGHA
jgi:hypothetical protein